MLRAMFVLGLAGLAIALAGGCATAPTSEVSRAELKANADRTIEKARATDPSLKAFFGSAAGYAVFPAIGKGGAFVGGAYGRGILYEKGKANGFCDVSQASVGLQFGGQSYSEIIFFQSDLSLAGFKSGSFAFSAAVSAVAVTAGAGANAKYTDGVAVFTFGESGLMYEASVGGQKFSWQPGE